jgi:uncharacterized membrane protein (DUF106 family)
MDTEEKLTILTNAVTSLMESNTVLMEQLKEMKTSTAVATKDAEQATEAEVNELLDNIMAHM